MAMCVLSLFSCADDDQPVVNYQSETVPITFACSGDFTLSTQAMTRSLEADGKELTDIWILDYQGTNILQQLHQVSTDIDFGTPTLNLSVGSHNLYFIASRGASPTLSTADHTITFGKVLDTFYKSISLDVSATSGGTQTITLERCVTKLKIVFEDEIPTGAASFNVTPTTWYYGIDYTTGLPTDATPSQAITVNIPSSSIGKSGESVNIYGFSGIDEWATNITLDCKASDNSILGNATITTAPLKRNRITSFSGPLFSGQSAMTLALSSDWIPEYTATW